MNFSRSFTLIDYLFLISFILIYGIYFYKIFKASRQLGTSSSNSIIKFVIRSLYFGLMAIAALAPNFGVTEVEARELGKDVFLAIDLSESMNAGDVEPSRLDKAKVELLGLIRHFESDRLGIIVFNSEAYMLSPLTFDIENIQGSIRSLQTSMLERGSTDFDPVFDLLNEKFDNDNRAKAVVFVTDGESHYGMRKSTLESINNSNIAVFFLGVGSLSGSNIPTLTGVKKDKDNQEVITYLDIKQINEYAKATGGEYYILNNEKNEVSALLGDINSIVGTVRDSVKQTVTYNKYIVFLLLALMFLVIDFLITIRVLKV